MVQSMIRVLSSLADTNRKIMDSFVIIFATIVPLNIGFHLSFSLLSDIELYKSFLLFHRVPYNTWNLSCRDYSVEIIIINLNTQMTGCVQRDNHVFRLNQFC